MSSQDDTDESQTANTGGSASRATGGSVTISGSVLIAVILAVATLISISVAFLALGRAEGAVEQARLMERETRVMEDDLKYMRAYLSARGIDIPATNHEAEDRQ